MAIPLVVELFHGKAAGPEHAADGRRRPDGADFALPALPALRVLILSDIRVLSEGLVDALDREPEFEVTGAASGIAEGIELAIAMPPDLILIDAGLPGGPAVAEQLRRCAPLARLVALAVVESAAEIIPWATAGVCGYIPRTAGMLAVAAALKEIARGEQSGSSEVMGGLLQWIAEAPRAAEPAESAGSALTLRERQVAALIDAGLSNKEIARRLNIGVATAKSHVHNLLGKLELARRSQVTWRLRRSSQVLAPPAGSGGGSAQIGNP